MDVEDKLENGGMFTGCSGGKGKVESVEDI